MVSQYPITSPDNFTQLSTYDVADTSYVKYYTEDNFQATGNHTVLLSGDNKQVVSFSNPAVGDSHFNILEINNTGLEGVTFNTVAYVTNGLNSTTSEISNSSNIYIAERFSIDDGDWPFDLTIAGSVSLEQDQEVLGNLYISSSLNLSGYDLFVGGDIEQSSGTLTLGGGYLTVSGNYRMQTPDESSDTGYTYSSGYLKMTDQNDYMLVHGDFVMDSRYGGYDTSSTSTYDLYSGDWLTDGTLEVKGNFTQLSTYDVADTSYVKYYTEDNFQATGNHKVILYGTEYFEDPSSSYFNFIEYY